MKMGLQYRECEKLKFKCLSWELMHKAILALRATDPSIYFLGVTDSGLKPTWNSFLKLCWTLWLGAITHTTRNSGLRLFRQRDNRNDNHLSKYWSDKFR